MKKQTKIFFQGFTLVEVMIVIAIIGITAAISIASMGNSRTLRELETNAREFTGVVREAQNYALTGKQIIPGTTPCGFVVTYPSGTSYELLYLYKDGVGNCNQSSVIASYTLKNDVTLTALSGSFTFSLPHAKLSFPSGSVATVFSKGGFMHTVCVFAIDSASSAISDYPGVGVCPATP